MSIEVMKQALEALDLSFPRFGIGTAKHISATAALRQAIAEAEKQEPVAHWSDCAIHSEPAYPAGECDCGGFNPVAWLVQDDDGFHLYWTYKEPIGNEKWIPLFKKEKQ